MRYAPFGLAAALLAVSLAACGGGEGPSGPPPEAAGSIGIDPTPRVWLPPTVELRPRLELYDTLGERIETPPHSAFEWTTSNSSVATVSEDGVIRVRGAAPRGSMADIRVSYGEAEAFLTVFKSEPPVEAKVVPTSTITPGAQRLLFAVAVNPQGQDEEGHLASFSLIEGGSIARIGRVGASPDLAWLYPEAPGQVVVQAELDGVIGSGTITVRTVAFASVTAGGSHTCGITTDDALFCWGAPFQSSTPVQVIRPGYSQVQAGDDERVCGLDAAGLAQCWFLRGDTVPQPVSPTLRFTRLSVGALALCGLEASGKAWCWGENGSGQLGDGSKNSSPTPVAVAGGLSFTDIAASTTHTCALVAGGAAYCWGTNADGVLGDTTSLAEQCGIHPCSTTPIPAAEGLTFAQIIVGENYSCGRSSAGTAWCWGNPGWIGTTPTGPPGTAEQVAGGAAWSSLAGGVSHLCGVRQDGSGFCWGENRWGQTGQTPGGHTALPTRIPGGLTFSSIEVGSIHTCGVTGDGLYCWGDNGSGQLGVLELVGAGPVRVAGQE